MDGAAAAADGVPPVDNRKRLEPILTLENAATPLHIVRDLHIYNIFTLIPY